MDMINVKKKVLVPIGVNNVDRFTHVLVLRTCSRGAISNIIKGFDLLLPSQDTNWFLDEIVKGLVQQIVSESRSWV